MKKVILTGCAMLLLAIVNGQTNVFPADGNVGIGTTAPAAKLSFTDVNQTTDPTGICWYGGNPTQYAIHRTAGSWDAPNYQQLRVAWATGIILDPASDNNSYNLSYVEVKGKGLRVSSGSVGIGAGVVNAPAGYLLAVSGKAIMEEIKIKLQSSGWPDYVFKPSYKLMSLNQVENFIKQNGHLPEVPSAQEVAKNGVDVGANQAVLLKKIEELTLHLIEMEKKMNEEHSRNEKLAAEVRKLLRGKSSL
ncbi:MAG: hypothetical protein J7539_16060 [Niabella sp.]|nr:hypothetical protein [Niabella sp.]